MEHSSTRSLRPSSTESRSTARPPSSTQKLETYEYKTLTVGVPSPLMTASLNSRHSASSVQESTYLSRARWLRRSRLALTLLIIGTGVAAVACSGHAQKRYNSTHLGPEYHLTLWPINIDLRPNLAILNSAAIVVASSIGYLVFSVLPSVRKHSAPSQSKAQSTSLTNCLLSASFTQCLVQHLLRISVTPGADPVHLRAGLQPQPEQSERQASKGLIAILDVQVCPRGSAIRRGCGPVADPRLSQ